MSVISFSRPTQVRNAATPSSIPTVVSAYLDGEAEGIDVDVLHGIGQFERACERSRGCLHVTVDGMRPSRPRDVLGFVSGGLVPSLGAVGTTVALAMTGHPSLAVTAGVVGAVAAVGIAVRSGAVTSLQRLMAARHWPAQSRYVVGQGAEPRPPCESGSTRLVDLLQRDVRAYPGSRHILYLSGHGDEREVAGLDLPQLSASMKKAPAGLTVDGTVLDACLTAQIEGLAYFAPWAGTVISSTHEVPSRGMPIAKMFSNKNLPRAGNDLFVAMATEARRSVKSLAVIDTRVLAGEFLPALDRLGQALVGDLSRGYRGRVRRALASARSPEWFPTSRVDMGSFLQRLAAKRFSASTNDAIGQALAAYEKAVPYTKNRYGFSFDLLMGRYEDALPQGWQNFLREAHYDRKPLLPF